MNFTAIDFETANETRASACSLGITVVKNGQIIEERYYLIRPQPLRFNAINTSIHGLSSKDVKKAKTFDELWPEISPYFQNQFIVAHNASFDMSVLRATLDAYRLPYPVCDYACTMLFAKNFFPHLENAKLNTINHHLGLSFNHHHAGADAHACANILLHASKEFYLLSVRDLFLKAGIKPGILDTNYYVPPKKQKTTIISSHQPLSKSSPLFHSNTDFFQGKHVVFTGTLHTLSREEAIQLIGTLGGTVGSSVTKRTQIIITGINNIYNLAPHEMTTKLKKAITLVYQGQDILFLTENEFLKILTSL